ncbi:MAG: hypothetical protein ACKOYJ_08790 [Planctomycetia bacterium]
MILVVGGRAMSFFEWLREGVRQAVVLGLADAVEDVGTRNRGEDLGPALAQSLRDRLGVQKETAVLDAKPLGSVRPGNRRRLGRSLDISAVDAVRKAA